MSYCFEVRYEETVKKITLIIILILLAGISAAAIWQRDNIKAFYLGMKYLVARRNFSTFWTTTTRLSRTH
ncbi:MAG: hypothetical protein L6V93_03995 [Clostridiales bacterium]|nr:MAG: hypothetical protein L6V93_03995 [Clostridiales bacterium]